MATPGDMLREAREKRGWTVDEAAATRLPHRYITNLEANRFEEIGVDIFVRGYVRNYARELQADEWAILAAFEIQLNTLHEESEVSFVEERPSRFHDVKASHIIAAALALFGLVAFVGLVAGSRATAEKPASFEETTTDSQVEADVQKTRWLLEQPPDDRERLRR